MRMISSVALAIILFLQCQRCLSLYHASTAVGFGKTMHSMHAWLFGTGKSLREVLGLIEEMNLNVQHDIRLISQTLQDLPSVQDLSAKGETLENLFANVGQVFKEAFTMKRIFGRSEIQSDVVEQFQRKNEADIDKSIAIIQSILVDEETKTYLLTSFHDKAKNFKNICKSGMSNLQLMDTLLGYFKFGSIQYYMTKNWMYTLLEQAHGDDFAQMKQNLLEKVHQVYKQAMNNSMPIFLSASQEFWKCDPPNGFGNNFGDSTFVHLKAFTAYYFNENNFSEFSPESNCGGKCSNITHLRTCGQWDTAFCQKFRACPGTLVGCRSIDYETISQDYYAKACGNGNKLTYARYRSIIKKKDVSMKFSCAQGEETVIIKNAAYNSLTTVRQCDTCECLCEESVYYISTALQRVDDTSNLVVTGARLRMVGGDTIFLQLQQGKLLANGTIDKKSTRWLVPSDKVLTDRMPITWNGTRTLSLGKIELPKNRVIVGLQFRPMHFYKNKYRFYSLRVVSQELDFRNGRIVNDSIHIYDNDYVKNDYDLEDADVPTKSNKPNTIQTSDDQLVTFGISSLEKDGGQSTIPFIDTQEVVTNPPTPLSGAQLYIRGQKGSGGFLGLKLFTYNIRKFITDDLEFKKEELARTVSKAKI